MASRKPKQPAKAKRASSSLAKKSKAPAVKTPPAKKAKTPPAKKAKTSPAPLKKAKTSPAPLKKKAKTPPVKKAKTSPAPLKKKAKTSPVKKAKPEAGKRASAPRATPARDARSALLQKRAITATLAPVPPGKDVVDAYLRDVDHPFKAEMEAVRRIILGASSKISERIKWNAPSFHYKEDLGAFNPRATEFAHLILLFPGGAGMQAEGGLLEGEHKDRREVKFHGMDDVAAKKPALEKLIKRWVALRDR
jgi:hypothetical protein